MSPETNPLELDWYIVENPPGHDRPQWQRSACVDIEGDIYAPAGLFGDEARAHLCAMWDGVSCVFREDHVYLPTYWLAKHYPDDSDLVAIIEVKVDSLRRSSCHPRGTSK